MSELKAAILDAKYIDMVSLADFVVRDLGLPDMDDDGNFMPQANEVAAAVFRWAAEVKAAPLGRATEEASLQAGAVDLDVVAEGPHFDEYDAEGDPILDVKVAERLDALKAGKAEVN